MPSPELHARFSNEIARYSDIRRRHLAYEAGEGESPTREEYEWVVKNASLFQDLKKGRMPPVEDEPKAGVDTALDSLRELFGGEGAWKSYEVPTVESLGLDRLLDPVEFARLSSLTPEQVTAELDLIPYVQEHFPPTQSAEDSARGLTRHRPSWWGQEAKLAAGTPTENILAPTWGLAYLRSIAKELQDLQGSTVLLDTAIKPVYTDGSQHYGSREGTDPSLDPLLPLFQEVFGEDANRFNHTWDELHDSLLPAFKAKLQTLLASKGLPSTDFDVILAPFHTDQRFMVDSPESSSTGTWEWTGTSLIDAHGSPTGHRLLAGALSTVALAAWTVTIPLAGSTSGVPVSRSWSEATSYCEPAESGLQAGEGWATETVPLAILQPLKLFFAADEFVRAHEICAEVSL